MLVEGRAYVDKWGILCVCHLDSYSDKVRVLSNISES
jgi:hypothetical protein